MIRYLSLALILICSPAVRTVTADTIILKDGSFFEGELALETSRRVHLKTRFGIRSFRRSNIERIIVSGDVQDPTAGGGFSQLPAPVRAVLNAEAEYALGQYKKALARVESLQQDELSDPVRIRAEWLVIEIYERLGRWEKAKSRLTDKKTKGTPQEKIRAKAHLDIIEANPDYDLRYVRVKHARNFIQDEVTLAQARQPGALTKRAFMRLALEEYCEQLLVEDAWSVKGFADKLDVDATYEACQRLPGTGEVGRHLPYFEDLKNAEATLGKAQAILGDYGTAFEMDLVRTELYYLLPVLRQLFADAVVLSPEKLAPAFDRRTGQLTRDGRRAWQQRCDEFLDAARPVARLVEYMIDRVEHFPDGLRDLRSRLLDYRERTDAMINAVKKARHRTRV